jgi:prenyltransferase beta subunit
MEQENRIRKVKVKEVCGGHYIEKKMTGWFGIKYTTIDSYIKDYREYEGYLHKIESKRTRGVSEDGPYMETTIVAIIEDMEGKMHETTIENVQYIDRYEEEPITERDIEY